MNKLGVAVAIILGIGLLSVGVAAVVAPELASTLFGMTATDPTALAYVKTTGLRDIVLGGLLFAFVALRTRLRVLGTSLMIFGLIPAGDAINVWLNTGSRSAAALALHIVSAIAFLVLGFWFARAK